MSRTAFGASPFRTRQRQYTWQNEIALDATPVPGRVTIALERREERVSTDPELRGARARHRLGDRRVRGGARPARAAGEPAPRPFEPVRRRAPPARWPTAGSSPTRGALTLGASTGFKAPTFNDLYYPGFSNPDLAPETARNVEAGLRYAAALGGRRASRRRPSPGTTACSDLIVFQCDADFVCAPANVVRRDAERRHVHRRGGARRRRPRARR